MKKRRLGSALAIGSLAGLLAVAATSGAQAAPATPPDQPATLPIAEALPLARMILERSGVADLDAEDLTTLVDRWTTRLLIADDHAAINSAQDLQDLVSLAVVIQLLEARGEGGPALRRAAASTAFLVHAMGHAFDTREEVRATLEAFAAGVEAPHREGGEALLASVRGMRAVGRRWFPEALHASLADNPRDGTLHHQRSLWLLREDRPVEALEAAAIAFHQSGEVRHALTLYDALLTAARTEEAAELAGALLRRGPALRGRLEALAAFHAAERHTRRFERPRSAPSRAEEIAQLGHYQRLGRTYAALALARDLVSRADGSAEVLEAAAEVYVATQRFGRLAELLAGVEGEGAPSLRLREARIAGVMQARMMAAAGAEAHAFAAEDLAGDLAAVTAADRDRGRLLTHAVAMLTPVLAARRARARGESVPDDLVLAVHAAVEAGREDLPGDPTFAAIAASTAMELERPEEGRRALERALDAARGEARETLRGVLARVEAGHAVRNRDPALLARALERLGAGDAPRDRYARVAWELAALSLDGASLGEARIEAAIEALPPVERDFDTDTWEGLLEAAGAAMTLGALRLVAGHEGGGTGALTHVRRLLPDDTLGLLAAGQAQAAIGDPDGALALLMRADLEGEPEATAFMVEKWRAWLASLVGDRGATRRHIEAMMRLWDRAGMPDRVEASSLRPLFLGGTHVGFPLVRGQPLRPEVRVAPLVILVADLPHDRAELRALVAE